MQPTPDFNPSRSAKSLLRRNRQGALATLMAGTGDPYCSLVNVASHPDGSPILLISRLAVHTRNILADARVSLIPNAGHLVFEEAPSAAKVAADFLAG